MKRSKCPDYISPIPVTSCSCGADLTNVPVANIDCRQVFEYQGEIKTCLEYGQKNKGQFPAGVNSSIQYGPRFRAMLVYMQNQHFMPVGRLSQMVSDLYGTSISVATILDASSRIYDNLATFEEEIVDTLSNSKKTLLAP